MATSLNTPHKSGFELYFLRLVDVVGRREVGAFALGGASAVVARGVGVRASRQEDWALMINALRALLTFMSRERSSSLPRVLKPLRV